MKVILCRCSKLIELTDGGPSAISWSCHRWATVICRCWPTDGADDGPAAVRYLGYM